MLKIPLFYVGSVEPAVEEDVEVEDVLDEDVLDEGGVVGAPISPEPSSLLFASNALHTRSGDCWSVLTLRLVESPGLIGFEEKNAIVSDDVFLPCHPLSSLNDKKDPLLICKVNENMFDVLDGLLVICNVVMSPVLVDVTETVFGKA